jgi:hypothetical protein
LTENVNMFVPIYGQITRVVKLNLVGEYQPTSLQEQATRHHGAVLSRQRLDNRFPKGPQLKTLCASDKPKPHTPFWDDDSHGILDSPRTVIHCRRDT